MEITILGCGSSIGVPAIGCNCKVCTSSNIKNKRSRASIYIKLNQGNLLIDTSPDLRQQALSNNITQVDAVFFTHPHADHIAGIDDLRSFNYLGNKALKALGSKFTLNHLEKCYSYCFTPMKSKEWYKPMLEPIYINDLQELIMMGHKMTFIDLPHGGMQSTSIKIDNFCFSTDFKSIPEEKESFFYDLDLWIIDCLKPLPSPGHLSIEESLALIEKFKPKKAILFHLAHEIDYDELTKSIPSNVALAYDDMNVKLHP
jgi:phosphoribosyl 1,2-cyclic phosphate phosphodiesterase